MSSIYITEPATSGKVLLFFKSFIFINLKIGFIAIYFYEVNGLRRFVIGLPSHDSWSY